jgi:hypothetical protein
MLSMEAMEQLVAHRLIVDAIHFSVITYVSN